MCASDTLRVDNTPSSPAQLIAVMPSVLQKMGNGTPMGGNFTSADVSCANIREGFLKSGPRISSARGHGV